MHHLLGFLVVSSAVGSSEVVAGVVGSSEVLVVLSSVVGSSEVVVVFSVVGGSEDAVVVVSSVVGDAVVCRNVIVSMLAIPPIPTIYIKQHVTLSWARSSIQWQDCV